MKKTIHLHGELGEKFGKTFSLAVETANEAGRALAANLPGFRQYVATRRYRVVRGDPNKGMDLDEEQIGKFKIGARDLHIIPYAGGAGGKAGGVIKIVLGIVLVAVGIFTGQYGVALAGLSLVLSGVSTLLTPTAKPNTANPAEAVENKPSYLFNGTENVIEQGHPIAIAFGRVRVGSIVVSTGLEASESRLAVTAVPGALGQPVGAPYVNAAA